MTHKKSTLRNYRNKNNNDNIQMNNVDNGNVSAAEDNSSTLSTEDNDNSSLSDLDDEESSTSPSTINHKPTVTLGVVMTSTMTKLQPLENYH